MTEDSLFGNPEEEDEKDDLVPCQPSDLSEKRKDAMSTYPPTQSLFQFEYRFKIGYIKEFDRYLQFFLDTHDIQVNKGHNLSYGVKKGNKPLVLLTDTDTDGNYILKVSGSPLSFSKCPNLIEVLKLPLSPVEFKGVEVVSFMESVIETPLPWRFEFIYDPEETFDRSYDEYKSILQWIVDQEVVRFTDEHKFKEPEDEHPTFVRIRETPEGKPILMLEGYSIEDGEILDHLLEEESPFEFRRSYVVGRKPGNDPKARDSEAIRRNLSQSGCYPHASTSSPISNEAKKDVYQVWVEKQRTFWRY
jgi:hypothetical protein